MVREFEEVVFNLEPGEFSEVFKSPFGWHIAHVEAKAGGETPNFDDICEPLKKKLYEESRNAIIEAQVDTLREKATIEETAD